MNILIDYRSIRPAAALSWWTLAVLSLSGLACLAQPKVELMRTPYGGIQPQAVMDERGVFHLVYYKGEPGGGDIYYVRRGPGRDEFSSPIRVNSQSGSAVSAFLVVY